MARGVAPSTHLGRDRRGGWHRGGRTGFVLGVWGSEEPTNLRGERGVVSGESSSRDFFFERRPRGGWNRERTVFVKPPIPHRRGVTILFSTFSLLPPSPPPGGSPPYGEDRPPLIGVPEGADMAVGFCARFAAERQTECLDESGRVREHDRRLITWGTIRSTRTVRARQRRCQLWPPARGVEIERRDRRATSWNARLFATRVQYLLRETDKKNGMVRTIV